MSVLVSLPNRGVRAFCKGASEIILRICDKIIDSNGNDVDLPEEQANKVNALRTLSVVVKDIDATEGENSILDNGYTLIIVGLKREFVLTSVIVIQLYKTKQLLITSSYSIFIIILVKKK
ncbi:hypothetical protein S83_008253 [Arachis hypogaea]|nr:Calcium-transporting ATPase 4, plasma membrane-type [Arachis hypogaea]